jgi:hypothetical protein
MLILIIFHFLSLYFKCKNENELYSAYSEETSDIGQQPRLIKTNSNNFTLNHYKCHLFAFDLLVDNFIALSLILAFKTCLIVLILRLHMKQNGSNTYNYWSKSESVQFSQLFNHFFLTIYFGNLFSSQKFAKKSILNDLLIFFVF